MEYPTPPAAAPPHAAYVEDCEESDSDESSNDAVPPLPPQSRPAANVTAKRSDPNMSRRQAQKQKQYATSDSGYSSLTTTTSSSNPADANRDRVPIPSSDGTFRRGPAPTVKPSPPPQAPAEVRPLIERRVSKKPEMQNLRLRSVESREDAARMRLSGTPVDIRSHRPSISGAVRPPSPEMSRQYIQSSSRPIPRPRPTASQSYQGRPVSMYASSAPQAMYAYPPYVHPQQVVQLPQRPNAPPLFVNTAFQPESYPPPSMPMHYPTPTPPPPPASPHAQMVYPFPQNMHNPYFMAHPQGWTPDAYTNQHRRMSLAGPMTSAAYTPIADIYSPMAYQQAYQYPRRQSTHQIESAHPPPPPVCEPPAPFDDEALFMVEDEDYYRMPPPPPPRPASSRPERPAILHARTTSTVHPTVRTTRDPRNPLEHASASSPRKQSRHHDNHQDEPRPASRPGTRPRRSESSTSTSTSSNNNKNNNRDRMQPVRAEPISPLRHQRRPISVFGPSRTDLAGAAAEAYQAASSPRGNAVTVDDLTAPLARRKTRGSSDAGSNASGSRDSREERHAKDRDAKRLSRLGSGGGGGGGEGLTVSIGSGSGSGAQQDIRVDMRRGSVNIKQARESEGGGMQLSFGGGGSRPGSARPHASTRDPGARERDRSAARPSGASKRYIEGGGGGRAERSRHDARAELEVAAARRERRRSVSVAGTVGDGGRGRGAEADRAGADVVEPLRRRRMESLGRLSRRSSKSGKSAKSGKGER